MTTSTTLPEPLDHSRPDRGSGGGRGRRGRRTQTSTLRLTTVKPWSVPVLVCETTVSFPMPRLQPKNLKERPERIENRPKTETANQEVLQRPLPKRRKGTPDILSGPVGEVGSGKGRKENYNGQEWGVLYSGRPTRPTRRGHQHVGRHESVGYESNYETTGQKF